MTLIEQLRYGATQTDQQSCAALLTQAANALRGSQMSTPISTTLSLELTLHLTGLYHAPSAMNSDTGGAFVEDAAIEGLTYEEWDGVSPSIGAKRTYNTIDLLAGVDTSNPEVLKLLGNLFAAVEADAMEELAQKGEESDE